MKLNSLLKELFDDSLKPYDLGTPHIRDLSDERRSGDVNKTYTYEYTSINKDGEEQDKMEIELAYFDNRTRNNMMVVMFGKQYKGTSNHYDSKFGILTGTGDMFRIMRTILEAMNKVVAAERGAGSTIESDLKFVGFEPASSARDRIYNSLLTSKGFRKSDVNPRGDNNVWYINPNYKSEPQDDQA